MIHLTRMNKVPLVLNCDLIEFIEATPDTVVSLTNGQKLRVLESPDEIIKRVVQFRCDVLEHRVPEHCADLLHRKQDEEELVSRPGEASGFAEGFAEEDE